MAAAVFATLVMNTVRPMECPDGGVPTLTKTSLRIPAIGFGVGTSWFNAGDRPAEDALASSIEAALDAGIYHIDDAEMYRNEATTGRAIRAWLARSPERSRADLFVTNKVSRSVREEGGILEACKCSLQASGLEYFDLYLIHAPVDRDGSPYARSLVDMWREMETLVDLGLARAVGVSNFRRSDLESLESAGLRVPIACNQIEAHPLLQQPSLEAYCAERGIVITAFSPLAPLTRPSEGDSVLPLMNALNRLAAKHGCTPAQVLLRWGLQHGRGLITTTSKPERLAEYLAAFQLELSDDEVAELSAAGKRSPAYPQRHFWKSLGPPE